jgi:hypothetical protein
MTQTETVLYTAKAHTTGREGGRQRPNRWRMPRTDLPVFQSDSRQRRRADQGGLRRHVGIGEMHRARAAAQQGSGVRAMIETCPLGRAAEAYARTMSGDAQFRIVLTMA